MGCVRGRRRASRPWPARCAGWLTTSCRAGCAWPVAAGGRFVLGLHLRGLSTAASPGCVKSQAGRADHTLLTLLKRHFTTVKHAKPPASRKGSSEWYVVAQGFKGGDASAGAEQA